jgi:hypothetical protein
LFCLGRLESHSLRLAKHQQPPPPARGREVLLRNSKDRQVV